MIFFLADGDFSLKGKLENLLDMKGVCVGDEYNFKDVRFFITEPSTFLADESGDQRNAYLSSLMDFKKMYLPVILYSEVPEERINEMGFKKGMHYDEYFSKFSDINRLVDYVEVRKSGLIFDLKN